MTERTPPPDKKRQPRSPRKATPQYLENAALYYLERFSSSAENLRQVLMRRVHKSAHHHGTDPQDGAKAIDDIIERFLRSGLLNDDTYARARVTTLRRRGDAARSIHAKLRAKGVAADVIERALDAHAADEDGENAEKSAAVRLAKRRGLGPFRKTEDREVRRQKDLAALARAGFSFDVARGVIDAEDVGDLTNGD